MELTKEEAQLILDILLELEQIPSRLSTMENGEEIGLNLFQKKLPMLSLYAFKKKLQQFVKGE